MFLSECSASTIKGAAQSLAAGHLVAFPTETVYGLGADATNENAVTQIYKAKGRPADHPLIVHIASIDAMGDWAEDITEYAINLARDFWPGPMTLVFISRVKVWHKKLNRFSPEMRECAVRMVQEHRGE